MIQRPSQSPQIRVTEYKPVTIVHSIIHRIPIIPIIPVNLRTSTVHSITTNVNRSHVRSVRNLALDNSTSLDISMGNDTDTRLKDLQNELAQWKYKYQVLEAQYNDLLNNQQQHEQNYKDMLQQYKDENDKLGSTSQKQKQQELQNYKDMVQQYKDENDNLRQTSQKQRQQLAANQNEIKQLKDDDQKLKALLKTKENQIKLASKKHQVLEYVSNDYSNTDSTKAGEKEQIIDDLTTKSSNMEAKHNDLLNNHDDLKNSHKDLQNSHKDLLKSHNDLKTSQKITAKSMESKDSQIKNLEDKVAQLSAELYRQQLIINEKTIKITTLTQEMITIQEFSQKRSIDLDNQRNKYLDTELRQKQFNEQTQDKITTKQMEIKDSQIKNLEDKVASLNAELYRQQMINNEKTLKITTLTTEMISIQEFSQRRTIDQDNQRNKLLDTELRQKQLYIHVQISNEQIQDYQSKIKNLEENVAALSTELYRQQMINNEQAQKITTLTQEMISFQEFSQRRSIDQDNQRNKQLDTELRQKQFNEQTQEYQLIIQMKYTETIEITRKNTIIQSELTLVRQRLDDKQHQLEQLLEQFANLHDENKILQNEITRLEKLVAELKEELYVFKYQYASQSSLSHKIQELLQILILNFVEIDSLRSRILSKDEEIAQLRKNTIAYYKK